MANSKKRCRFCKTYSKAEGMFMAPGGTFCNIDHAIAYANKKTDGVKAANEAWKQSIPTKPSERKEFIKTDRKRKKETDKAFNDFIRYRDKELLCISCDRTLEEIEDVDGWKPGGSWDAGHFLTKGAHEELRYEESNVHKQCKSCNGGSGKYTKKNKTVGSRYREKLIEKIGLAKVEWLEGPHEPKRYRKQDYLEIKETYKAKLKQLKKMEI